MTLAPRLSGNFQEEIFQLIHKGEGFRKKVYGDSIGVPTIGYGYALAVKSNGAWLRKPELIADMGGTPTGSDTGSLEILVTAEDDLGESASDIFTLTVGDDTPSIGGAAVYADLLFQKSGNDLILRVGASDKVTFSNYYAGTANPGLATWALTNALIAQHVSGSDTAAVGGDLAYRYGRFGTLADISFIPAAGILSAGGFGTSAQTLQSLASLQDAFARLS